MLKNSITLFTCLLIHIVSFTQLNPLASKLDSSNLPIVIINTNLVAIPDTIKIPGTMGIINNGYNVINHTKDPFNDYNGHIGIEKRGSISQLWPQKSYGLETRDSLGNNLNAPIIGMPKENDWVLYGPHDDKTLMRNAISYLIGNRMGKWAPRTKHCEVSFVSIFNLLDYQGTYVMLEKIKRDKNRVDISKLDKNDNAGDSLTGGYIIAVDGNIWTPDSGFYSNIQTNLFFEYKYPKGDEITPQQRNYIKAYIDSFETALNGPNFSNPLTGFRKYADEFSFIDFFIIQELSKNLDSYRRSSYLYKDKNSKGGKLIAGPFWDFNSAWGGPNQCNFEKDTGWAYQQTCWIHGNTYPIPFWWSKFLKDSTFANNLKCKWIQYRSTFLDTASLFHDLDSMRIYLTDAASRHYSEFNFNNYNFKNQVDSLKKWIAKRMAWMDANMPGTCKNLSVSDMTLSGNTVLVFPNPFTTELNITLHNLHLTNAAFVLKNILGETVTQFNFNYCSADTPIQLHIGDELPPGIYVLQIDSEEGKYAEKIIKK